ncbi:MAG: ferritin-like domain-containing protein [Deltaproteobacteria bacterium]|nr:ferritin-like domain-containing protein [Deltaproteobacteria bacterium]
MENFNIPEKQLSETAKQNMVDGAVVQSDKEKNSMICEALNNALATELVCMMRYRQHYFACEGINCDVVSPEFLEHANQELEHAFKIAARISQLGGKADFNPDTLSARSHAEYKTADDLSGMVKDDLEAERMAIQVYKKLIKWVGDYDPTTRRLLEDILAQEEEHADEMAEYYKDLNTH